MTKLEARAMELAEQLWRGHDTDGDAPSNKALADAMVKLAREFAERALREFADERDGWCHDSAVDGAISKAENDE